MVNILLLISCCFISMIQEASYVLASLHINNYFSTTMCQLHLSYKLGRSALTIIHHLVILSDWSLPYKWRSLLWSFAIKQILPHHLLQLFLFQRPSAVQSFIVCRWFMRSRSRGIITVYSANILTLPNKYQLVQKFDARGIIHVIYLGLFKWLLILNISNCYYIIMLRWL